MFVWLFMVNFNGSNFLVFNFGKYSRAAKDSIRLLFFCGLASLLGVLLWGYAGLTVEQLPQLVNSNTIYFTVGF